MAADSTLAWAEACSCCWAVAKPFLARSLKRLRSAWALESCAWSRASAASACCHLGLILQRIDPEQQVSLADHLPLGEDRFHDLAIDPGFDLNRGVDADGADGMVANLELALGRRGHDDGHDGRGARLPFAGRRRRGPGIEGIAGRRDTSRQDECDERTRLAARGHPYAPREDGRPSGAAPKAIASLPRWRLWNPAPLSEINLPAAAGTPDMKEGPPFPPGYRPWSPPPVTDRIPRRACLP